MVSPPTVPSLYVNRVSWQKLPVVVMSVHDSVGTAPAQVLPQLVAREGVPWVREPQDLGEKIRILELLVGIALGWGKREGGGTYMTYQGIKVQYPHWVPAFAGFWFVTEVAVVVVSLQVQVEPKLKAASMASSGS